MNPAVTVGLAVAKRFPWSKVLAYIAVQVLGGIVAGGVLFAIASGKPGFEPSAVSRPTVMREHSPGGYSMESAILAEARAHVHVPDDHPGRHR